MIAASIRINHEEAKIYDRNNFNPSYNYKLGHLTKSETNINTDKPKKKKKRIQESVKQSVQICEHQCPLCPGYFWL